MGNTFTKKQWTIVGLLFLGLILSLIISVFRNTISVTDILLLIGNIFAYVVAFAGIGLVIGLAMIASKLGIKKSKNIVLVINLGFLGIFALYTLFSSFSYYIIAMLLLIPILFYPTKKFPHLTSLFYFITGFAIPLVQMGVDNSFKLDLFILMITFWLYSLFPLIIMGDLERKKSNKQAEKTKLKFHRLKQSRVGVYLVLGIWLCFEVFFVYAYVISELSRDIDGFLMLTGFFSILFLPLLFPVYRKIVDIEIDTEKIIVVKSGKREEIKFKDINVVKIKGQYTGELTPFKTPILVINGKKNMGIKLSNYSSKGVHMLKNMLYTYAGEKFKDKKI